MFELKEYQARALDAFTQWLNALNAARAQSETAIEALTQAGVDVPDDVPNYPKTAWTRLAESSGVAESAGEYIDRTDDAGRPIHISASKCLQAGARLCSPPPRLSVCIAKPDLCFG